MDANNWESHNAQIKAILKVGEKRVISVEHRVFHQWQLEARK